MSAVKFTDWRAEAEVISANAKLVMANGFDQWQKNKGTITQFFRETPTLKVPNVPRIKYALNELVQAYQAGLPSYLAALKKFSLVCEKMENWDRLKAEVAQAEPLGIDNFQDDIHLFRGHGNAHSFVKNGWSGHEFTHLWAVEPEATLEITPVYDTSITRITIDIRALRQNIFELEVNGIVIGSVEIGSDFT